MHAHELFLESSCAGQAVRRGGKRVTLETMKMKKAIAVHARWWVLGALLTPVLCIGAEPTKAVQSRYEQDIRLATTSEGLTKADLAWHALNTYGWDCEEVTKQDLPLKDGYYVITCSSGTKLRVYPRPQQHPRITNSNGDYK